MRFRIQIFSLFIMPLVLTFSQEYSEKFISDPRVFGVNKIQPHAELFPYENSELSGARTKSESENYFSLNGEWKFNWVRKPAGKPEDFYKDDFDVSTWNSIAVPGHWELQGFGVPIYTDEEYPFTPDPPHVPKDYNPVGSYKRFFELPKGWADKPVVLCIGGARSAYYIWINGECVGYS